MTRSTRTSLGRPLPVPRAGADVDPAAGRARARGRRHGRGPCSSACRASSQAPSRPTSSTGRSLPWLWSSSYGTQVQTISPGSGRPSGFGAYAEVRGAGEVAGVGPGGGRSGGHSRGLGNGGRLHPRRRRSAPAAGVRGRRGAGGVPAPAAQPGPRSVCGGAAEEAHELAAEALSGHARHAIGSGALQVQAATGTGLQGAVGLGGGVHARHDQALEVGLLPGVPEVAVC